MKILLNRIRNAPYFAAALRLILGGIFLYASVEKIADPAAFAQSVQNYRLISVELTNLVGIILPWLELYSALFLILGLFNRASSAILSLLLLIFLIALTSAVTRGLDIDCGCYGSGTNVSWSRIMEDLLLLAIALHLFFFPNYKFTLDNYLLKKRD
jgi:putative oxidoreductase